MTQYPNDPGVDNQKPVEYHPYKTYEILTTDVFAAGMEIQTKYSYSCAKQLLDKAICHSNKVSEDLLQRIINLNNTFNEALNTVDDAIKGCHSAINELKGNCVELYRRTDIIRSELDDRLTEQERCDVLSMIYDIA